MKKPTENHYTIIILAVSTLIFFLLTTTAIGVAAAEKPSGEITEAPEETPINQEFNISFTITNPGNESKNISYNLQISPSMVKQEAIEVTEGKLEQEIELSANESKEIEITLKYLPDSILKDNEEISYKLMVDEEGQNPTMPYPSFTNKPIYPELETETSISETELSQGKTTQATIKIKNVGTYIAEDITTELRHDSGLKTEQGNQTTIEELEPDEEKEITYTLEPQKDGKYFPQAWIEYNDTIELMTKTISFEEIDVNTPEIETSFQEETSRAKLGEEKELTLQIENTGNASAEVSGEITTPSGISIQGQSQLPTLTIEPKDRETIPVVIETNEVGKYEISARISHEINDETIQKQANHTLDVEAPRIGTALDAPSTINTSTTETVSIEIKNLGNYSTTASIEAIIGQGQIQFTESQTDELEVDLDPGETKTRTLLITAPDTEASTGIKIITTYENQENETTQQINFEDSDQENTGFLSNINIDLGSIGNLFEPIQSQINDIGIIIYAPLIVVLTIGGWILWRYKQFNYK